MRKLAQARKQREALLLRESGKDHEAIAEEMGLASKMAAWRLVHAGIKSVVREPAEAVLKLELGRLDAMLLGCWEKAKNGDTASIDRALRIMDRRAAYLGLDQPKGLKVEMHRELEGFLERLKGVVDGDVYERVLAVAAGVDGAPQASGHPSIEAAREAEDSDEPDGS